LAGIAQLHQERDDAVKQLLTPEEARQYDLRMSSTARLLVHKLEAFEPSKSEFDAIVDLQKAVDDEFPGTFGFGIPYAQEGARIEALISNAGRAQLEQTRNGRWLETLLSLPVQPGAGPP
jgi:hypothetical protein